LESASLNFAKIEFKYVPQAPNGAPQAPIIATFDLKANKMISSPSAPALVEAP
jgi:hypothetical protein